MENAKSTRSALLIGEAVYLAVAVPTYVLFLGHTDLIGMEGIIALGARHVLDTHNWWVPRLYGDIYANKPALAYWLAAASTSLWGHETEFTLRLPTAMCALAIGLALCHTMGKLVAPRCGLYSALAAATSFLLIADSRMAGFDTPLALGLGIAVLAACRNLALGRSDWRYWLVGYTGLLFGLLAKGLPAVVIYLPGLVVAGVMLEQWRLLLRPSHLLGLALFFLGASAYLYLAYRAEGWLPFAVQLFEVGSRSADWTLLNIATTLLKPVIVLLVFVPWSPMLLVLASRRDLSTLPYPVQQLVKAVWAFLITAVLILMANSTSSTRYDLPLVVPVAMLSGLGAYLLFNPTNQPKPADHAPSAEPGRASNHRRALPMKRYSPIILTLLGFCIAALMAGIIEPADASHHSLRPVAMLFNPHLPGTATVYVDVRENYSSLFYYLGRPVKRWQVSGTAPPGRAYVVLVDEQRDIVAARSDLRLQILAKTPNADGHAFALGVIERTGSNPSPG